MDWPLPEWTLACEFTVLGEPISQPRHRHAKRGNYVKTYDPAAEQKEELAVMVQGAAPKELLAGPLRVDVATYFLRPKSHYGTGRNAGKLKASSPVHCEKNKDWDNLGKFICDALNKVFWGDDKQICQGTVTKQYSTSPRVEVRIYKEAS